MLHLGGLGAGKTATFGEVAGGPEVLLEGGEVDLVCGDTIVVCHYQGIG